MPKYVEVINDRIQCIGFAEKLPQSVGAIQIIDITGYQGVLKETMRLVNGVFVDDSTPVVTTTPSQLIDLQTQLKLQVNITAGKLRSMIVTVTPGQEMTYIEKGLETQRYLADPAPDEKNYPWLRREGVATKMTTAAVAQLVAYTSALWTEAGSLIEAARRGGIVGVEATTTSEEAYAAVAAIQWPKLN